MTEPTLQSEKPEPPDRIFVRPFDPNRPLAPLYKTHDIAAERVNESSIEYVRAPVVAPQENALRPQHQCKPLARALMMDDRDWWIGELLEPVPEWPHETHCLHMKTPLKDVSFLCNTGDFEQLLVLSNVVVQLENLAWLRATTAGAKVRLKLPFSSVCNECDGSGTTTTGCNQGGSLAALGDPLTVSCTVCGGTGRKLRTIVNRKNDALEPAGPHGSTASSPSLKVEEVAAGEQELGPRSHVDDWPIADVLGHLASATEHLLQHHDCDEHGHETWKYAAEAAWKHVALLNRSAATPVPPSEQLRRNPRVNALLVAMRKVRDNAPTLEAAQAVATIAIEEYAEYAEHG